MLKNIVSKQPKLLMNGLGGPGRGEISFTTNRCKVRNSGVDCLIRLSIT